MFFPRGFYNKIGILIYDKIVKIVGGVRFQNKHGSAYNLDV